MEDPDDLPGHPSLEDVHALAIRAHAGQTDPDGLPHIAHVERVAAALDAYDERAVALLHDVLEDSDLTADDLRSRGLPEVVVEADLAPTKRPHERYRSYIARVADAPGESGRLVRRVKVVDVQDNLRRSGSRNLRERVEKYRFALDYLTARSWKCPFCNSKNLAHEERDGLGDRRSFGTSTICADCGKEWLAPDEAART